MKNTKPPVSLNDLFFGSNGNDWFPNTWYSFKSQNVEKLPKYFVDPEGNLVLGIDLPGVKIKDVALTSDKNFLSVSAERKDSFHSGKYNEMFNIDTNRFNLNKTSAKLVDGVLIIKVPPLEEKTVEPKKIEVVGE